MSQDDEYTKHAKRLRDAVDGFSERLEAMAHRQDEFQGVNVDVRAELLRMDANQQEIMRILNAQGGKIDRIGRKLEVIAAI